MIEAEIENKVMKIIFSGLSLQSEAGERKPLGNDDDEGLCPSLVSMLFLYTLFRSPSAYRHFYDPP